MCTGISKNDGRKEGRKGRGFNESKKTKMKGRKTNVTSETKSTVNDVAHIQSIVCVSTDARPRTCTSNTKSSDRNSPKIVYSCRLSRGAGPSRDATVRPRRWVGRGTEDNTLSSDCPH